MNPANDFIQTFAVAVFAALILVLGGCETAVDPFQESDNYFSIGGVIDASADTQFVRLTPLRRSVSTPAEPIDALVTTTDLSTGQITVWHDSVFTLHPEGIAHNMWSAFDFKPGHSYRLEARRTDGAAATAVIALPDTFPEVVVQIPMFSPTATINVLDVEKLADLRLIFCGRESDSPTIRRIDVSLIERTSRYEGGFTTRVEAFEIAAMTGLSHVYWIRILAMAAGPDWPDFEEMDDETLALPDSYSNVEHGVGFVGGVTSRLAYWPGFTQPVDDACYDLIRRW